MPATDGEKLASGSLEACLAALAAGDLSARDRIIELCADRLRLLAHRMIRRFPTVRRWDDTDDVFQNAALRLHRALGQASLGSVRSVMALAATQLHRELIDLARRHAGPQSPAVHHGTNTIPRDAAGPSGAQQVDRAAAFDPTLERWSRFHEAIAALPDEQRETFHLAWYVGADQRSIAALLDCSPRTVKSRWREAREAVRAALGDAALE